MQIKIGDKLKVVANVTKHGFRVGQIVNVVDIAPTAGSPVCTDGQTNYVLHDSEYEFIWEV
ncbi:hypothetical protein [Anaerosporobacter sp.]|uniref:hypothetical protein n=1 Tax=Anaerosporobacter sp. TaxID=1872529 RepID=UPI00286EE719|nr:hypothetical protein [Anaerosporobacter sp.]